ncbi:MAG: sensor histidine kinase [Halodesulfurarchaeum sp.]
MSVRYWDSTLPDAGLPALVGLGALLGLAWSLATLSVVQMLQAWPALGEHLVDVASPVVFAVALFVGGIVLHRRGLVEEALAIACWTVLGTVGVPAAVVLSSLWVHVSGFGFHPALFTLVNAATGGAVLGFLVGIYDAEKRKLRRDLGTEHAHSARLSRRLSVINRVLRHDMRHQTQLIQGHARRLEDNDVEPEVAVKEIRAANDRLLDLAEKARKLQALSSGEEFLPRPLDLTTVAENACETVRERHPDLSIDCRLGATAPIEGTPLLEEVIVELLENAAEHNPTDHPTATVSIREVEESPQPVRLIVRDNGPGIPESEPVPENGMESPLDHSNGFGLWFVRWVVEETGGTVEIERSEREREGAVVEVGFSRPERFG